MEQWLGSKKKSLNVEERVTQMTMTAINFYRDQEFLNSCKTTSDTSKKNINHNSWDTYISFTSFLHALILGYTCIFIRGSRTSIPLLQHYPLENRLLGRVLKRPRDHSVIWSDAVFTGLLTS